MRRAVAALVFVLFASSVRADEGLPADTLKSLKAATVYVKVEAGRLQGSGSGFLLHTDKDTALLVTNHHVVRPLVTIRRVLPRRPPQVVTMRINDARVSVVFNSGKKGERAFPAQVLAEDEKKDLAILKITGARDLPRAISTARPPELTETMPVYVLGFPFGKALSTSKGHPAITVGKAAISSLRENDAGELVVVQIDGAINPGNSGGPVVTSKGQLVGVAVARIKDSGIGLAIPAQQLNRMLEGGVAEATLKVTGGGKDTIQASVEARLIDPLGKVKSVTLHWAPSASPGKSALSASAGARKLNLTLKGRLATGTITLKRAKGGEAPVAFQVEYDNGAGKPLFTAIRSGALKTTPDGPIVRPGPPLGKPLTPAELAAALADIKGTDGSRRQSACDRLAKVTPGPERKEVLAVLAPLLTSNEGFLRIFALRAHMNWAGKDGLPLYYERLQKDDSFVARGELMTGLVRLAGAAAAPAIAAHLPGLADRGNVSRALVSIGPGAEKSVLPFLTHADWGVRVEACKILKQIGTSASLAALGKAGEGLAPSVAGRVEPEARAAIAAISARK
jgi:S1-C subfamily serine protease